MGDTRVRKLRVGIGSERTIGHKTNRRKNNNRLDKVCKTL
jgi:hypothetical protein